LKKGRKLIYQTKEYEIFHIYDSGYCELKRVTGFDILLVSKEDLKINGYFITEENENRSKIRNIFI
jgi:hypothetical protein